MDVRSYKLQVPTLIMMGSDDTWTTLVRCAKMKHRTEGDVPLTLKVFDGPHTLSTPTSRPALHKPRTGTHS